MLLDLTSSGQKAARDRVFIRKLAGQTAMYEIKKG